MNELTHLDLFSGIGGFALAARWAGFRTIGFCEIDKYCQKVIAKNFLADSERSRNENNGRQETSGAATTVQGKAQQWERIWSDSRQCRDSVGGRGARGVSGIGISCCEDIREVNGAYFRGVTLLTGGFPCQPFSVAGKRRGKEDDRHLWPEMLRVIGQARPAWVLGENVTGIIGMELDQALSDLETIGYATRTFIIPACGVDAPHRRNRVWIVAHLPGERSTHDSENSTGSGESWRDSAGSSSLRFSTDCQRARWQPEPDVGRVAHGIPSRVDRLKALGNSIVPQVAFQILQAIAQIEGEFRP